MVIVRYCSHPPYNLVFTLQTSSVLAAVQVLIVHRLQHLMWSSKYKQKQTRKKMIEKCVFTTN